MNVQVTTVNEIAERRAIPAAPPPRYVDVWSGMDVDAPLVALLTKLFCDGTPVALISTHMVKPGIARTTFTPLGHLTFVGGGQVRHTSIVGAIPVKQVIRVQIAAKGGAA